MDGLGELIVTLVMFLTTTNTEGMVKASESKLYLETFTSREYKDPMEACERRMDTIDTPEGWRDVYWGDKDAIKSIVEHTGMRARMTCQSSTVRVAKSKREGR